MNLHVVTEKSVLVDATSILNILLTEVTGHSWQSHLEILDLNCVNNIDFLNSGGTDSLYRHMILMMISFWNVCFEMAEISKVMIV